MSRWFLSPLLLLTLVSACNSHSALSPEIFQDTPGKAVQFFYESRGRTVEGFFSRPEGNGRFPLVVLLHGHSWLRSGAKQMVPVAQQFTEELCYASLAISLPGYGMTDMPASETDTDVITGLILDGIARVRDLPWVDEDRVMLYGFSRGASFAAILAGRIPHLRGVVLHSGAYDLMRLYQNTPNGWLRRLMNPRGEAVPHLFNALADASHWRAPTLILHGGKDQLIPTSQAVMLHNKLQALGKTHRFVVFPDAGHRLPLGSVKGEVVAFLKQHVGSGCVSDL
ncbi:MAG: prolyl oligopeptidase family serine peptidase [Deltaproteobacteria bacterium]|nr:prolyl oligopeptidase family serine peptidase [Deltaproteobacteria bacterium]